MQMNDNARRAAGRFPFRFIASTEFFSYFVIIPLLFIYFMVNLDISLKNLILLLKILAVVVPVSMATTFASDLLVIAPVLRYLKKISSGEEVTDAEYARAQRRFFSLPYAHAIGSLIRWIVGLVMAYIPFTMLSDLSRVQVTNVWTTAVILPPFGMVLYFFLTERFLQRYLNLGFFSRLETRGVTLHINFMLRIMVSISVILIIPIIAVIGYFLLIMERSGIQGAISPVKLGMIVLFGILVSASLIYGLTGSIRDKVGIIISSLGKIGNGDFSSQMSVMAVVDDLTLISGNVFAMKENIADIIREIRRISSRLDGSTNEISRITESFSLDTQNQAATVEEITATIEEVSASMDGIAHNTQEQVVSLRSLIDRMNDLTDATREMERQTSNALALTEDIARQARGGEESLDLMKSSMEQIGDRSRQMTSIVGIINDISDKINLLSLNASIEAARAGDAGRGFAVVADEISKLADTTASSVKEIGSLIAASEKEIETGMATVNDVVERISRITRGVNDINGMMEIISGFITRHIESNEDINRAADGVRTKSGEIESSITEQKNAMNEVVQSVNSINELTQSISTGSENIAINTRTSSLMANELRTKVDTFIIA